LFRADEGAAAAADAAALFERLDRGRRLAALFEKKEDAGASDPRRGRRPARRLTFCVDSRSLFILIERESLGAPEISQ